MKNKRNITEIQKEISKFSEFLRKKNYKITVQRLLVAEKIFTLGSHFKVEDLTEILKDKRDEISRATIYRTVSLLVESGQLKEYDFGQSSKFYEFLTTNEHHDHIICLDCGLIEEFLDFDIEKTQIDIANKLNYELERHSLNLYGRCKLLKYKGQCERKGKK